MFVKVDICNTKTFCSIPNWFEILIFIYHAYVEIISEGHWPFDICITDNKDFMFVNVYRYRVLKN